MNIAIVSPEKFKFQDLVCIDLMLRFRAEAGAQFYVEPEGGEDGLLVLAGPPVARFEVQVKGAQTEVGLGAIANCLIHYPPRSSKNCLLERVYRDPNRHAVLVFSGRCTDDATPFLADANWSGEPLAPDRVTAAVAAAFRAAFRGARPDGSPTRDLFKNRSRNAQTFIDAADPDSLREALRRVIVLELRRDFDIVAASHFAMKGIPLDLRGDVLNRIRDQLAICKASGADAYPALHSILRAKRQADLSPARYALRGQEDAWVDELKMSRVLLMSGRTRVGKSDAARFVAGRFADMGYEVRQVFDPYAAERFLQEQGDSPRLVLLDDPLNFDTAGAAGALALLERLALRTSPRHAIIVAQGQETLLDVTGKQRLSEVRTGGRPWQDLSNCPGSLQESIWRSQARTTDCPAPLIEQVAAALRGGQLSLEPGCLTHLAAQHSRLPSEPTNRDFEQLAREDAQTLGGQLRKEGGQEVLLALAIGASGAAPIGNDSLAFVLGSGGTKLPAKKTEEISVLSREEAAKNLRKRLTYEGSPEIQPPHIQRIEYLELRRIVSVTSTDVAFSHPFYRAAALHSSAPITAAAASRALKALERALFCANSQVSKSAARSLPFFYEKLPADQLERRCEFVALAADAVRKCLFIGTRDLCFTFLVNELDRLPERFQEQLVDWVTRVNVEDNHLLWVEGEALEFDGVSHMEDVFELYRPIQLSEVQATMHQLRDPAGGTPAPQEVARLLSYWENEAAALKQADMRILLAYDEAAIRAKAAQVWLSASRKHDEEILEIIFSDNHPSLAKHALRGCIRAWRTLDQKRRELLQMGLAAACSTPAAAAAVLPELTVFGRAEYTGDTKTTPWDLFIATFPGVMRALPAAALYNDARSYDVVEKAIQRLPIGASLEAVDALTGIAGQRAARGEVLSDFEAGVATLLLRATASDPDARQDRVRRLLAIDGTAAALRILADLISHWESLRDDERAAVLGLLSAKRRDSLWLRALAVTRSTVPNEVALAAAGPGVDFGSADSILDGLPEELVSAAVRVFVGSPQPLWYIGTHHSDSEAWREVVRRVALNGAHPAFEIAWESLIALAEANKLTALVAQVNDLYLDRVFDILLAETVHSTSEFRPALWSALFGRRDLTRIPDCWRAQIDETLPCVVASLPELDKWFHEPYRADAHALLRSDHLPFMLLQVAESLGEALSAELIATSIQGITLLLEKAPPRLYETCAVLARWFSNGRWKAEGVVKALEDRRTAIFKERELIGERYKFDPGSLVDWIAP